MPERLGIEWLKISWLRIAAEIGREKLLLAKNFDETFPRLLTDADIPGNKIGKGRGDILHHMFFAPSSDKILPEAHYSHLLPGRLSDTHFHRSDQFQIIIGGGGALGRHSLAPLTVHFSRAFTPYGPFVANDITGMDVFVLYPHDGGGGAYYELDQLPEISNRKPWQINRRIDLPEQSGETEDVSLQQVPDIEDNSGLAVFTMSVAPGSRFYTPDPVDSDGQYILIIEGSLHLDGKRYSNKGLIYISPDNVPVSFEAGSGGVQLLILNFPVSSIGNDESNYRSTESKLYKKWQCKYCGFFYDEELGLPEEGIAPGTRWDEIDDDWICPDCGVAKSDFYMMEI